MLLTPFISFLFVFSFLGGSSPWSEGGGDLHGPNGTSSFVSPIFPILIFPVKGRQSPSRLPPGSARDYSFLNLDFLHDSVLEDIYNYFFKWLSLKCDRNEKPLFKPKNLPTNQS